MKAIITNEEGTMKDSKYQNDLDEIKDLIIGEYPPSFWEKPDIFKNLQYLVDNSQALTDYTKLIESLTRKDKLIGSYKEHFKCLHDDLVELIAKIYEVGMPLDEILEELKDFQGCIL
jgi:hypothetical protein